MLRHVDFRIMFRLGAFRGKLSVWNVSQGYYAEEEPRAKGEYSGPCAIHIAKRIIRMIAWHVKRYVCTLSGVYGG